MMGYYWIGVWFCTYQICVILGAGGVLICVYVDMWLKTLSSTIENSESKEEKDIPTTAIISFTMLYWFKLYNFGIFVLNK